MTITVHSYTIYHSPNAYLGTVLLRRNLKAVPGAVLVRHPIFVPRERGILVAEMLGGKENRNAGSYHREDCRRWADRYGIRFHYPASGVFAERSAQWASSAFHREELPARAFYAIEPGKRDAIDDALFAAAWVEGLDVNEPGTIRWAAARVGIDGEALLAAAEEARPGAEARSALDRFDSHQCPGVPTVIVEGERFFGKDRVDWIIEICQRRLSKQGGEK